MSEMVSQMSNRLSIFKLSEVEIEEIIEKATYSVVGISMLDYGERGCLALDYKDCTWINVQSGLHPSVKRTYVKNKHHIYGNYFNAYVKFGSVRLSEIPAAKEKRDDLVLSHLCGTKYCCTKEHMLIEPKWINDERTYCHFAMWNLWVTSGRNAVLNALANGMCPHFPRCGDQATVNQVNKHIFF